MINNSESQAEKIDRLRTELFEVRQSMQESEAELDSQLADIEAFEFEFEANVGYLVDQLSLLEAEVDAYMVKIKQMRHDQHLDSSYRPVEEQYRTTWEAPPINTKKEDAPSAPTPPKQPQASKAEIKRLYRQLARKFHPDLADSDGERIFRTEKMRAVNDAYRAGSMVELLALADELESREKRVGEKRPSPASLQTEKQMVDALEQELERCQRKLRFLDNQLRNLHNRPMVELMVDVKFGKKEGRDVFAEMRTSLERKIAKKTVERDMIKSQFNSLNH